MPHFARTVLKHARRLRRRAAAFRQTRLFQIMLIGLFLGINVVLLPYFLRTNDVQLSPLLLGLLRKTGVQSPQLEKAIQQAQTNIAPVEPEIQPSLEVATIAEKLNEARTQSNVQPLAYSDALQVAAEHLLAEAQKTNFEITQKDFVEQLRAALQKAEYDYARVSHNMVVGPLMEDAVVDAWYSDNKQVEAMLSPDFTEIGLASTVFDQELGVKLGVVVQIIAKPHQQTPAAATQKTVAVPKQPAFPPVSDSAVFTALNQYRQTHGIPQLTEHQELCKYAQKRVGDLVAFGGLDGHAGFRADFADPNNLPEPIRNYPGKTIAENLAFQYCKNMTTGDSFIAETGTALIEWCFDSSTAGHREAQLNPKFNNVCVRHDKGLYVVIFGD